MCSFKLKMHQNRFRAPAPTGGAYKRSPGPLVGWDGDTKMGFLVYVQVEHTLLESGE